MKKTIFLTVLIIVLTFFIAGCSAIKEPVDISTSTNAEPPDILISIDNKEIEYVSAKNKWDGSVYDREDTFVTILKEKRDIPIIKNGSIAEITFKSNPPDEFKIMDILIDEEGRQIYADKEIINIPVELIGGKCSFEIEKHLASSLSSYYEPEKKDIRGFRMIASWGENECEYAFVIKTYETDETLAIVQNEVKTLTGLDNLEISELFSIEDIYYIKVKIHDLMLHYEYIYEDSVEDEPTAFTAYTDRDLNNIEKEISGDYYEIWRYEKGDLKRILYNMENVVYSEDDDKIFIDGAYNSYVIKLGSDNEGKEKILYECYYTEILNSDNGDFTCYINDFFSVCVVDNKANEIILNKYIDLGKEFSNEDFILDNNRVLFPTRMYIMETGWIKNSNLAYFLCHDLSYVFLAIDIDKKIVSQPNFTSGGGYESFIDKDKGYILSSDTFYALDINSYMMEHLEKQYNYLYLINLYTSEKFEIAKSIRTKIEFKKEDEKTISYTASSGERVTVDISDMIGKEHSRIREGFIELLYSELNIDETYNVKLQKFNDIVYALVDDGENKMLIQYTDGNKLNIIADNLDDINFSELGKYINLYNENGDIIVLDKNGNKYLEDNVFNYVSNNGTGSKNQNNENNIGLGVTIWGKNNDKLYILTKKDDRLDNIFEVNMIDKSIRDLASDIDCRYENLYIDISEGYVVYSTFPGPIFYYYDKVVNDDVFLCVKYFTGEKVEIAQAKGENIEFYIFDNELNYYCRENDDIEGTYSLAGNEPD